MSADYTVDTLRTLARRGDAEALFRLGELARLFNDDAEGAVTAFRRHACAALHGHSKSMWVLGTMLENGTGADPDRRTAARWYRRAADLGSPEAHLQLTLMQATGRLPVDVPGVCAAALARLTQTQLRDAVESFIVNAWHGYRYAKFYLGMLYDDGTYAAHDPSRAREWYEDAARDGIRAAQVRLAQLYGHLGNIALARHWSAIAASRSPLVEDSCDLPGSAAASDPTEEAIFLRRMLELVE